MQPVPTPPIPAGTAVPGATTTQSPRRPQGLRTSADKPELHRETVVRAGSRADGMLRMLPTRISHDNSIGISQPFEGSDGGDRSCVGTKDAFVSDPIVSHRQLRTAGKRREIQGKQQPHAPKTTEAVSRSRKPKPADSGRIDRCSTPRQRPKRHQWRQSLPWKKYPAKDTSDGLESAQHSQPARRWNGFTTPISLACQWKLTGFRTGRETPPAVRSDPAAQSGLVSRRVCTNNSTSSKADDTPATYHADGSRL